MNRIGFIAALLVALVVCGIAAASDRIDPELRGVLEGLEPDDPVAVIVKFTERVPLDRYRFRDRTRARVELAHALRAQAERSQAPIVRFLGRRGVEGSVRLWLTNALAARVPAHLVPEIAALPGVDRVVHDRVIRAPSATLTTGGPEGAFTEWNIERIGAPDLWGFGFDGTGVVVATLDWGVDVAHQDLAGRWRGGSNSWYDPNGEHATPHDPLGHGTQVMGVLVGGDAGGSDIGVAPGAQFIAVKIFDDAGETTFSKIHQGYQWVLDPDGEPGTDDAADVVNNSWGLKDNVDECVLEFEDDIQALEAAGIAVVFSAGNSGPAASTSVSPANNPSGFAVGATAASDTIDGFSSRGPSPCDAGVFPDIAAPGVDIWTADLTFGGVFPDSYTGVDGTSFAAPHVSGALALLIQAFPAATVADLRAALSVSALDLGDTGPDTSYGHGLLDVSAAYAWLDGGGGCTDADGDGRHAEAACDAVPDCDDDNGQVWGTPGEVPQLSWADGQTLQWSPPIDTGGEVAAVMYDILRSNAASDFQAAATCLDPGGADTEAIDAAVPAVGQVFHYLARAINACPGGTGSLGTDSSGAARVGAVCAP